MLGSATISLMQPTSEKRERGFRILAPARMRDEINPSRKRKQGFVLVLDSTRSPPLHAFEFLPSQGRMKPRNTGINKWMWLRSRNDDGDGWR